MKKLFLVIFSIATVHLLSCDPRVNDIDTFRVRVTGQILNPKDTIVMGDTIKVYFEVPDTVEYNGSRIATVVGNNDAFYVGIRLYKIDQLHAGSIGPPDSSIFFASIGSYTQFNVLICQKVGNKLKGQICFILRKKGVYFLENTDDGYVQINNGNIKAGTIFNYGSINRNHQMLIDSAGSASNFSGYLLDHTQRGLEVYGFNVK